MKGSLAARAARPSTPEVVACDDEVEVGRERELLEHVDRADSRVVRPHGRGEAAPARARDRLEGAGLEGGVGQRTLLVREGDRPDSRLERRRRALTVGDQLPHAVALGPLGQRSELAFDERPHVDRHRGEVERRRDERVIEVEDTEPHRDLRQDTRDGVSARELVLG